MSAARADIGELPLDRAKRFEADLGLNADGARNLAFRGELGDYFERVLGSTGAEHAVAVANWIGQLVARIGDADPADTNVTPQAFGALVMLVGSRAVSGAAAREVLDVLVAEGGDPQAIIDARGLGSLSRKDGDLATIVARAIAADPSASERVRAGNDKAIGALVGAVMRETRGRADGAEVTRLIHEQLAT